MADEQHAQILSQGVPVWNQWRSDNPQLRPDLRDISFRTSSPSMLGIDLSGANLQEADLQGADFYRAWLVGTDFSGAQLENAIFGEATLGGAKFRNCDLREANFMKAHLFEADFTGANLTGTMFFGAFLEKAILSDQCLLGEWFESAHLKDALLGGADLSGANLRGADLQGTDLRKAVLCHADLQGARLIETQVEGADFSDALVHGISVWAMKGTPKKQEGLRISSQSEATLTVDDLDVAQFLYLLLTREKLRNVIDTITSKAVLILGRFKPPERKAILDVLAEELRIHHLLPIIFDFEGSTERDLTETIKILAGMSLFVIVDVTDPKCAPLELQATVPDYQIPFVTIIQKGETPFAMLDDLKKYDWVLPVLEYPSSELLRKAFKKAILDRALAKHHELKKQKAEKMKTQSVEDFLGND